MERVISTIRGWMLVLTAFFCCVNSSFSQELPVDTISLESVSVYHSITGRGTRPGTKTIKLDTLVFAEKIGLSLSELLHENSPIFIKTYGRGSTATASFRGTGASHTNVYWNGIKINSSMSGEADFSLVPLYFIDDVAIHFGHSSMSFGSGGLGGSVNLFSKPNWSKQLGATIYQSIGSFSTYSTAASTTYGKGSIKAQTRVFRESSENDFTYYNTAKIDRPLEVQKNADYQKQGILQELYYRRTDSKMLSAKIWVQETQRGIPKLMSNFSVNEINRQSDQSLSSVVEWQSFGDDLTWKASSGFSLNNLNYNFEKLSNDENRLPILEASSVAQSWFSKMNLDKSINQWFTITSQVQLSRFWVSSAENIIGTGYNENQTKIALSSTIIASLSDRLLFALLVGNEMYDQALMPITYSITGEYRLLENHKLTAKGGLSRNFNHPSLNDMYWQPGGNPDLKPEEGISWELGLNHILNKEGKQLEADLNFFASKINNWILWLPHLKGYWEPINLNSVRARGFETSLKANFSIGRTRFQTIGSYSYTKSTIVNAGGFMRPEAHGKQLPFIPVHSGGIVINCLWNKFHLVYSFTHFSERYTTTSNNPNSIRRLYPYYMSSAAIGKDVLAFNTRFGIQLRVDNLLNESYQTILWRPMPGRNYNLVIKVDL